MAPTTDRRLSAEARSLCTGRRAHNLTTRWAEDPHLAGINPAALITLIAQPRHPASNPAFAALIRRGQTGDADAVLLSLAGLRLGLWGVAHQRYGHRVEAFDELLTQATFVLARINPDLDRLYDRILGRARAATSNTLRHRPAETPIDDIAEQPHRSGMFDPVGDQVAARLDIDKLRHIAASGTHCPATWNALIATRLYGVAADQIDDPRSARHLRADTSRLARRLQQRLVA